MSIQDVKQKSRVITHGNNGFKSAQLLNRLHHSQDDVFETEDVEFFPFSDQNVFKRLSPIQPNPELLKLIERSEKDIDVSAILVLISQTEIFSEGMNNLIGKLSHNSFYQKHLNEKDWWKHVIVVFSFGENVNGDEKAVKRSIAGNKGIKELVKKTGNRYIWMSNMTTAEEVNEMLQRKLKELKGKEIKFPVTLHYQTNQKISQTQQSQLTLSSPSPPSLPSSLSPPPSLPPSPPPSQLVDAPPLLEVSTQPDRSGSEEQKDKEGEGKEEENNSNMSLRHNAPNKKFPWLFSVSIIFSLWILIMLLLLVMYCPTVREWLMLILKKTRIPDYLIAND